MALDKSFPGIAFAPKSIFTYISQSRRCQITEQIRAKLPNDFVPNCRKANKVFDK